MDESWPTHGWPDAAYCREKAYLERALDIVERDRPGLRVVRMRPAFLFKRESASEQRRIFGGRYLPGQLARPDLLPFLPDVPGLRMQVLHTDDAARAYRLAVLSGQARGPYNLAAEPTVDVELLAGMFGGRRVRLPRAAARSAVAAAWGCWAAAASPPVRRGAAAAADGLHPGTGGPRLAADAHGDAGGGGVPAGHAAGRRREHGSAARQRGGVGLVARLHGAGRGTRVGRTDEGRAS